MTPSSHLGPFRWGVIGTGAIAAQFVRTVTGDTSGAAGKVMAIGSRTQASAEAFLPDVLGADCHRHGGYDAVVDDPEVDAVYIATPHPMHVDWAIGAAQAGKHVLCEKPLTMTRGEALKIIDAARQARVLLMEAFMYKAHPQHLELSRQVQSGRIGEVRFIENNFGIDVGASPAPRMVDRGLGGGALLDLGCYTSSMVRFVAGAASGFGFAIPPTSRGRVRSTTTGPTTGAGRRWCSPAAPRQRCTAASGRSSTTRSTSTDPRHPFTSTDHGTPGRRPR